MSNGRPRGSHGVMVGLQGPRGSRVWPKGSQGVKGLTCMIPGGQWVSLSRSAKLRFLTAGTRGYEGSQIFTMIKMCEFIGHKNMLAPQAEKIKARFSKYDNNDAIKRKKWASPFNIQIPTSPEISCGVKFSSPNSGGVVFIPTPCLSFYTSLS